MLREIFVDLESKALHTSTEVPDIFGKALAIQRIMRADEPERTIYLTGYTPITASGLGFAGKLNVYGVSLLGGNLQGSRSGGLVARFLARSGITGIQVTGESKELLVLLIDGDGRPHLRPLAQYGDAISGSFELARRLYREHGEDIGLALTDPATTGFLYNAIVCNSRRGGTPDRAAARSTSIFGRNGLVAIAVEHAPRALHKIDYDRKSTAEIVRKVQKAKWNPGLTGSNDPDGPMLGGTYGAAARARFDSGHCLTNLFRGGRVPDEFYESLLPEAIVQKQLELARRSGLDRTRHACLPGCPNKCEQVLFLLDEGGDDGGKGGSGHGGGGNGFGHGDGNGFGHGGGNGFGHGGNGEIKVVKSGEWETIQGCINLGLFADAVRLGAHIIEHSNNYAYDHIEALVALAALALTTETKRDTGVRYGDAASVLSALDQAAEGKSELGVLIRRGARAVEDHCGLERRFTVGGHAMPFHNGRSLLQTGIGFSWTYGRHGEACAGPGRKNFLGNPYNPADHALDPETHVLNTMHGMILYGAVDEHGMCFFIGPSIDTLTDAELILKSMGTDADVRRMVRDSARSILDVYDFNAKRGVSIQPLPRSFYEEPTYGNKQTREKAVVFNVPFEVVRDYGLEVLKAVASGESAVPDEILENSRARHR